MQHIEIQERNPFCISGWTALIGFALLLLVIFALSQALWPIYGLAPVGIVAVVLLGIFSSGLLTLNPNEAAVFQFMGKYVGTEKRAGLRWTFPFFTKRKLSLRIRNFETSKLKVNDLDGSPVEIACIVVWKISNSAEALFQVVDIENFVRVQSEAAVRNLAMSYPYDAHDEKQISLRNKTDVVAAQLGSEIQERLRMAGVDIVESRISHLAYAPEIAANMLQRQQASAIVAARQRIVEGAVGMVETALVMLEKNGLVQLDNQHKAAMVCNLLVVLCGERSAQPVINTASPSV